MENLNATSQLGGPLLVPGVAKSGGLRTQGIFKQSSLTEPLLTIITVVYNGQDYLEETILSVINQTYANVEYLIIDGGSTDGTLDILQKYQEHIDYWLSAADKGISDAFNKGISLALGEYLNFQGDGDGFSSPTVLSEIAALIVKHRDLLICGRIQRISPSGDELYCSQFMRQFKKTSLLFKMALPHQGLFTHIKLFQRYGLFDINNVFCMDYEFLLRAYHDFPAVTTSDLIVAKWRADGIGTGRSLEIFKEYAKIKRQHKVTTAPLLALINYWTLFKYYTKQVLSWGAAGK